MRDLDWFDGSEEQGRDRHPTPQRRRLLLALGAVPWVVVAAFLVLPLRPDPVPSDPIAEQPTAVDDPVTQDTDLAGGGHAEAGDGATAPGAATEQTGAPEEGDSPHTAPFPGDGLPTGGATLEIEELRGRWRVAPGEEELAALAVVAARAHLTGIGPGLHLEDANPPADSYAEHLVVEAVEHPSAQTAVVTVLAVLLVDPPAEGARVELRRLAVPFAYGPDGPATAGPPWDLSPPALPTRDETVLDPVDDPDLLTAADSALAVAGLGTQRTTTLRTAPGWPVVATTTDTDGQERQVWLRRHLDGFVVAGSTLAGAVSPSGSDERDPSDPDDGEAAGAGGAGPSGEDPTATDGSRQEEEGP